MVYLRGERGVDTYGRITLTKRMDWSRARTFRRQEDPWSKRKLENQADLFLARSDPISREPPKKTSGGHGYHATEPGRVVGRLYVDDGIKHDRPPWE